MKALFASIACTAALAALPAHATTVTFDDLSAGGSIPVGYGVPGAVWNGYGITDSTSHSAPNSDTGFDQTITDPSAFGITDLWAADNGSSPTLTVSDGSNSQVLNLSSSWTEFAISLPPSKSWEFTAPSAFGQFAIDDVTFTAGVPEPATWAFMILGLAGIGAMLRLNRGRLHLA